MTCPRDPNIAERDLVRYRYDILYWQFLYNMAIIASFGAQKYGDFNWQKSRLSGGNSCPNHIAEHLRSYMTRMPYDHLELGDDPKYHLVAIAFNAMMEFWYEENMPNG